jgi:hypothetical protein
VALASGDPASPPELAILTSPRKGWPMSEQKPITKVPDGKTPFYTTRQMPPNAKGFVGYETIWKPFQKEVEYKTPKTP